jgi:hypothetical protein
MVRRRLHLTLRGADSEALRRQSLRRTQAGRAVRGPFSTSSIGSRSFSSTSSSPIATPGKHHFAQRLGGARRRPAAVLKLDHEDACELGRATSMPPT